MITPLPSRGDVVDVTLKGVRVTHVEPASQGLSATVYVQVPRTDGGVEYNTTALAALSPAITVTVTERSAPAEWPPRPGDLWRDADGDLWFARTGYVYQHGPEGDFPATPVVELAHAGGGGFREPDEVNRQYGPLELVRREQAEPAPEPGSWPPQAGEVWKDRDGDEWTATTGSGEVMFCDEGGNVMPAEDARREWGPLTFARRQQDEAKR